MPLADTHGMETATQYFSRKEILPTDAQLREYRMVAELPAPDPLVEAVAVLDSLWYGLSDDKREAIITALSITVLGLAELEATGSHGPATVVVDARNRIALALAIARFVRQEIGD